MRVILIDNYDSFTYNVADVLARLGAEVDVIRNDQTTVAAVLEGGYDAIVLSPGPGGPADAGICLDLIPAAAARDIPLLGICLGMQCIGAAYGGTIARLGGVVHGSATPVVHDDAGLFAGLPQHFDAGRYHSLVVDEATLPTELVATAHTDDGVLMGLRHREQRVSGVQFHPESILTPEGPRLLQNFLAEVA
ncbi:MAG: putative glutamine amidotransferase [Thermoleophilia bacterium]|nr:putative glutamine amidotransferase [Thermoleophilia bacterium]